MTWNQRLLPTTERGVKAGMAFVSLVLFAILGAGASLLEVRAQSDRQHVAADRVYYGNPKRFLHGCELSLLAVFKEIPEYRRIIDEKIAKDDPNYAILLTRANRVFNKAVSRAAYQTGHDLVAEIGAITPRDAGIPDLTRLAIAEVKPASGAARE